MSNNDEFQNDEFLDETHMCPGGCGERISITRQLCCKWYCPEEEMKVEHINKKRKINYNNDNLLKLINTYNKFKIDREKKVFITKGNIFFNKLKLNIKHCC